MNRTSNCSSENISNQVRSSEPGSGANLLSLNQKTKPVMPLARVSVNRKLATVLFDSDSDRTYVTQEFVRRVKPRCVKQTSVSFATFDRRSHYSKTIVRN